MKQLKKFSLLEESETITSTDTTPLPMAEYLTDQIDPTITTANGLTIGNHLFIDSDGFKAKMEVIGFDSSGIPFVKYLEVHYEEGAKPDGEKEGDEFEVGDILPFPYDDAAQYLIKN